MRVSDQLRHPRRSADLPCLVLVHSHLRWDFVWQRPQQLFSRFDSDRVVFVEEAVFPDDIAYARLAISTPHERVQRVVPLLPAGLRECADEADAVVRRMLKGALSRAGPLSAGDRAIVQWFYTPMPAPAMLDAFGESAVVYDCMDDLSKFRFAPPELSRREQLLMSRADVVFTGGYQLFESRSRQHHNVHFFGCGVDAAHFATARLSTTVPPADVANIRAPVLGYFGVIDERLDYRLLAAIASAHPEWSIVMIGPLAKVSPAELPMGPNIHWLGLRDYTQLPSYVKAFDVCLMPFALNEATEYINPTKTLEYMAGGKPIVSTAVPDVVRNFTPIVRVARSGEEFIEQCAAALGTPDEPRIARGIERAEHASWESIVSRMRALITEAIARRGRCGGHSRGDIAALPGRRRNPLVATAEPRDDIQRELP
jgi:glycosyltransferase involved in cell wall biosynthesis